ncbi:protein lethal(2)k10201 [Scaptodrosophila lebanonensis]|uniref:Protein lethal(2)k10201 n=1 Tax=Drosophila lebanonensis TaxID=7225 RepID=A0A6J2UIG1_DROLE|nr:protein lethal(2)k10201 [Scaptodrosophila lebanonensis]
METKTSPFLLTKDQLSKILHEIPAGYIKPTDPLLVATMPPLPPYQKLGVLVERDDIVDAGQSTISSQSCNKNIPTSVTQSYTCAECKRTLPTAHLLDLHITEQHDTYFAASVERGDKPMFSCYLEECTFKMHTAKERKDHCITVHKFPPNYRFDQSKSKAYHEKSRNEASMDVDELAGPTHNKIPYIKAFSFGHYTQRTFNTRRERREPGTTLLDVQDMKDALEDMD